MLTHHNVIANYLQAEAALNIQGDDQVLGLLPMFHMYGMFMFLVAVRFACEGSPVYELLKCSVLRWKIHPVLFFRESR